MTGTLIIIALAIFVLWTIYTGWSAPLMQENKDGSWTTLRPEKKFSDLFKKKETKILETPDTEFNSVEAFQKLAGIKPHDKEKAAFNPTNNKLNETLVDALMKAAELHEFPAQDESIPVRTERITTIQREIKEDNDPLASIPMSRVSKEAKLKIAQIAKEDINRQLEENASNLPPAFKAKLDNELEEANKIVTGQTINDQKVSIDTEVKRKYKKRKPKTISEWETEIEIGGHE